MATAVKQRRGNTSEHGAFTGLEAEITVNTETKTIHVHDGSTAGGIPLAKASELGTASALVGTANITTVVNSTNQTASDFYGQRMIHTGGAVTYAFAATGAISGADVGKSLVIANAGTDSITCNYTTSKFYKMISGVNSDVGGSGASSITIAKGGIAEIVITETNKAIVFGAGVS